MENYILWTHHGERGVVLEDSEEDDYDDNYIHVDCVKGEAFSYVAMGEGGEGSSRRFWSGVGRCTTRHPKCKGKEEV
jgi:hypothetical protein